jgi:mono/diheme cytochrome c family protein
MNHDMIAAGHPPLRFEQASYEALLRRKHWDDRPQRAADPQYEVQLWAAGRKAAAEAALALLEGRARRIQEERAEASWPEFAEANCFACHQPLRSEVGRLPLATMLKNESGVPAWQTWNTALVEVVAGSDARAVADVVQPLREAMERSQVADAAAVSVLAREARNVVHRIVPTRAVTRQAVLERLGQPSNTATWDELCQRAAALAAVERSLRDRGTVAPDQARERLQRVADGLKFTRAGIEWPVVFESSTKMSMADMSRELEVVRRDLLLAEMTR